MPSQVITLIAVSAVMFLVIGGLAFISHYYTLDGIKSKTVGDGQHGTARWATKQEIRQTYAHIPFEPELWRKGEHLPEKQGLILGCEGPKNHVTALVDTDDIHAMVTAASGAGKTAFFLYPNIEYALASGMSFLCTDTKGDLYRNYAGIAKDFYGYQIAVLDLRNPTRSDGNNLLHLINKYMDIYKANPNDLAAKAKSGEVFQDPGQDTDQHQRRRQRPVWTKRLFLRQCRGAVDSHSFCWWQSICPLKMRMEIRLRNGTSFLYSSWCRSF